MLSPVNSLLQNRYDILTTMGSSSLLLCLSTIVKHCHYLHRRAAD